MATIRIALNIIGLVLVVTGCTFAKHKPGSGAAESVTNICKDSLDYKVVHTSLIQPKCLACHGAGSGLVNLDTFEKVKNNIARIQAAVQAGRMPPNNPLGENEKVLLTTWIDAGTPESVATNATACNSNGGSDGGGVIPIPVLAPNYESISKMILEPRCLACHDAGSSLDFSTYTAIISHTDLFTSPAGEDGDFVEAVASGMMPPKKLPKLSPEEVDVIRQWVILGMPEKAGGAPAPSPVVVPPTPAPTPAPAPVNPLPPDIACMDFATIKATVLEPKCVGCHGGSGGVDLDSYAAVKAHLSKVDVVVAANKMPPKKPLDPVLKDQLLNWIKDGAPETCAVPPVVEPLPPLEATYNSMKLHFLEAKCIICHDGSGPRKKGDDDNFDDNGDDEKPDFSTYKAMVSQKWLFDFKKPHKSEIVDEVIDGDMPPPSSSAKPLTQIEIQTLIDWIKNGLPEG